MLMFGTNGIEIPLNIVYLCSMFIRTTILSSIKKSLITLLLVSVGCMALASLGDGGKKKKQGLAERQKLSSFSLRSKNISFKSSQLLQSNKRNDLQVFRSVVTYKKDGITVIQPSRNRVSMPRFAAPNSRQMQNVTLRLDLH